MGLLGYFLLLLFAVTNGDDLGITINTKKSLHILSEQFISFSIDPALLFNNFNFTTTSFNIANQLAPAFIRLSGPSTRFLQWTTSNSDNRNIMYQITPQKWTEFNDWALNTNLTPIFALNDRRRINQVWDPRDSLPIMTLTDKMNYSCFWELGYECQNTSLTQYIADLTSLQHILDAFPASKDYWGTIGSDFSGCVEKPNFEVIRNFLTSVENSLDAINWHVKTMDSENNILNDRDPIVKALQPPTKAKLPVMLTAPQTVNPMTFLDALTWASELGDAAKYGFGVIFRQPSTAEILEESPVFWTSLVHKHLLGRNVLDVKITNGNRTTSQVYAHCTKRQNIYIRRGAMTIFAVNKKNEELSLAVKFFGQNMRSAEVQSYILTSNGDLSSSEVFMNNEPMNYERFIKNGKFEMQPKIRRAKMNRFISLTLPPYSIGFFVFPSARSPACILGEEDPDSILEEISEDQNIDDYDSSDSSSDESMDKNPSETMTTIIVPTKNSDKIKNDWKKTILERAKEQHETKNILLERAKIAERKAQHELEHKNKHKTNDKSRRNKSESRDPNPLDGIELTSEEVRSILLERAKNRIVEKHADLTSEELEEIITAIKSRPKRFIPVEMLKTFAEKEQSRQAQAALTENPEQTPKPTSEKARPKREIPLLPISKRPRSKIAEKSKQKKEMEDELDIYFNPNIKNGVIVEKNEESIEPKLPKGDVYVDLLGSEESVEVIMKNENYDYINSDESFSNERISLMSEISKPMYVELTTKTEKKGTRNPRDRAPTGTPNKGTKASKPSTGINKVEEIVIVKPLNAPRADQIIDLDSEYYHPPNEYYENLDHFKFHVRDDWRPYGELWEIDNMDEDHDETFFKPIVNFLNTQENVIVKDPPKVIESEEKTSKQSDEAESLEMSATHVNEHWVKLDGSAVQTPNHIQKYPKKSYSKYDSSTCGLTTTVTEPETTTLKPRKEKDVDEERGKRAVDHIQKIPPRTAPKLENLEQEKNIQTITPRFPIRNIIQSITKGEDDEDLKSIKRRLHRDRRQVDEPKIFRLKDKRKRPSKPEKNVTPEEKITTTPVTTTTTPITTTIMTTTTTETPTTTTLAPQENELEAAGSQETAVTLNPEDFNDMDEEYEELVQEYVDNNNGPLKFVIGRPYDESKLKPLNERRIANFQKYLKTRLARRKKLEEKAKVPQNVTVEADSTTVAAVTEDKVGEDVEVTTHGIVTSTSTLAPEGGKRKPRQTVERGNSVLKFLRTERAARRPQMASSIAEAIIRKREAIRSRINSNNMIQSRVRRQNQIANEIPVVRSMVNEDQRVRNRRSAGPAYFELARENEIVYDSKEHPVNNWIEYKIQTPNGKRVIHFDNIKSAEMFEKKYLQEADTDERTTSERPATPSTLIIDLLSDEVATRKPAGNPLETEEDTIERMAREKHRREGSDEEAFDFSGRKRGREAEDSDESSFEFGHPEPAGQPGIFAPAGRGQLVGNFLRTISSVLDHVHQRLIGYFHVL